MGILSNICDENITLSSDVSVVSSNMFLLISLFIAFVFCAIISLFVNFLFRKGQYIDITQAIDTIPSNDWNNNAFSVILDKQIWSRSSLSIVDTQSNEEYEDESFEESENIHLSLCDPLSNHVLNVPDILLRNSSMAGSSESDFDNYVYNDGSTDDNDENN